MTNPDNVGGLLPCPFCGGESERIDFGVGSGDNEGGSCIACKKCQASGPVEFGYKENFVSNWNRRKLYSASSGDAGGLPELPPSYGDHCVTDSVRTMREPGYTADQMRAYGELCRAAPAGGRPYGGDPAEPRDDSDRYDSAPAGGEPNGKLVGWWNGITPGFDGMGMPSIRWGADAEDSRHDIPLYDGYNPIHYVTPVSASAGGDSLRALVKELRESLEGVVRVADRNTDEFDRAREAIARASHVFVNAGDSEAQFIADGENLDCPTCGGSGHAGDSAPAGGEYPTEADGLALELVSVTEERDFLRRRVAELSAPAESGEAGPILIHAQQLHLDGHMDQCALDELTALLRKLQQGAE